MAVRKERPKDYPKLKEYTPTRFMLPTSHYDKAKADRAVRFIENLSHTKGKWSGKPFFLLPWEEVVIRDVFGTVKEDGTRQFRTAFVEIPKKNGKQLSLDTPIPTPTGFTSMGDLKVGDSVFDENGIPCHVVAKSEVDDTEQAYRLTFRDGSSIVAGKRHLWDVEYIRGKPRVMQLTTGEIFQMTAHHRKKYSGNPKEMGRSLIRIPVSKPLQCGQVELPVDPYLYGYWLGNGCANKPDITVRDSDVEDLISFIPYKLHNRYPQQCGGSEILNYTELKKILVPNFRNKVIRPEYLRASEAQRWALLQGLIDSDGSISARKALSTYVSTIKPLAESVRELLWSLGIKNAMHEQPSTRCGIPTGETLYTIRFTTFDDQPTSKLHRKISRKRERVKLTRSCFHYLKDIEPVEGPVRMQCIQVDSPSHCYLAGRSMVKTHNSELAAAVALYMLYADNEPSAEVYSAASDRQQASIVFDVAKRMTEMSPALLKRSKIMAATKRIVNYQNAGFYQVLSAEVGTKHGLNVSGLCFDEIHALPNRELYDVLTKGSGDAREQSLFFIITTAGNNRESIAYELHTKATDILNGRVIDPTFYPVVYSLGMDEDWTDEKNWYRANPSLGYTIKIDRMREAFRSALQNPAEENVFRWLRLNQWVGSTVAWIPDAVFMKGDIPIDLKAIEGRECYAGLDLSSSEDTTALVLIFPPQYEGDKYVMLCYFWVPEDTIPKKVRQTGVPYDQWLAKGHLMATPGDIIDYQYILNTIGELSDKYHIMEIAFDRWGSNMVVERLTEMGLTVVQFGQGFSSMSAPTKMLYELLMKGEIAHGGNPVLRWMAGNVQVDTDPAGNLKVTKKRSTGKVDGIVAAIMALDRCIRHEQTGSVYDDPEHGLLVF